LNHPPPPRSPLPLLLWLGAIFFVVYAALVPLQFQPRPLDEAWALFKNIPYVDLTTDLHADLIANGVLYIPVAFFSVLLLRQRFSPAPTLYLVLAAGLFSAALAPTIEWAQVFFPPRTVKLNDILSEWLGSLLGLALAARYASAFLRLLSAFGPDPQRLRRRLLDAYALVYLGFSLFPFDLMLSWSDWEGKLHSNHWGWLLAGAFPGGWRVLLQGLAEILLTVPLGVWLVRLSVLTPTHYLTAALFGLLMGAGIEVAQFFLYSGMSQGASAVSRALGVCGGVALYPHGHLSADQLRGFVKRYWQPLAPVYLFALLFINHWWGGRWRGWGFAAAQWAQVNFVPLYYHYYAGEAQALLSLLVVGASYAPLSLLGWAYRWRCSRVLGATLVLVAVVEGGKLFLQPGLPDPSNLWLACAANALTLGLLRQLFRKAAPAA